MRPSNEWLNSLKVGDEVAYNVNRYGGTPHYIFTKIIKITPTGQIVTDTGHRFRKGKNTGAGIHIEPITPAIQQQRKDARVLYELQTTSWQSVPPNKRDRIYAILMED